MSSAPRPDGKRGVDLKSVVLGCAQPGEEKYLGQFSDALRHLSDRATHLYVEKTQYWYSLAPNVTRIAVERAANFSNRDADELVRAIVGKQRDRASFHALQIFAEGPGDVPDNDDGVRLVVLSPNVTHSLGDNNSSALKLAEKIIAQRDAGPRVNRNLLVFVAAQVSRLGELRDAARSQLAWGSIIESDNLELTPQTVGTSENQKT